MYERNYKLLSSKFREFLIPTFLTSMAGNISIFVDAIIVSLLIGTINLSVMQIIEPVSTFLNLLYWMIGLGGSIVCSFAKAEFNKNQSNEIFTSSMVSIVVIGLIISLFSIVFSNNILQLLCHPISLKPLVSQYFIYYVLGIPFLCYMMSMSYYVRVDGFLKLPFISLLIANVLNLVLDVVLIKYFNMGIGGAALATTIGYVIGSVCISTYFLKNARSLKFIKIKLSTFFNHLKDICKSGFSTASTQLYLTIKLALINIILSTVSGAVGLTAFNMCYNTLFLISIFVIGIVQSMSPIVSVYYKEKDYSGVDYIIKKSAKLMIIVSIAFVVLLTVYPQALLLLFHVDNTNHMAYIMNAVRIFSLCFLGLGLNFLYIFYAQAIQKDRLANIIQITEGLILPIFFLIVLFYLFGDFGIWISFFITEIVLLLSLVIYSKYINKNSNGQIHGFFINKSNDGEFMDYTINANLNEAMEFSTKVNEFFGSSTVSIRVSLAIEEILVNIIKINKNLDTIDIYLKKTDEEIIFSIKDAGIEFNPVIEHDELKFDNITVLNKIADKIDYSRVLGLNNTVIIINT